MMNDWEQDCLHWRGKILKGLDSHWCPEFDDLPIDMWCIEYAFCYCEKPWYLKIWRWLMYQYVRFQTRNTTIDWENSND